MSKRWLSSGTLIAFTVAAYWLAARGSMVRVASNSADNASEAAQIATQDDRRETAALSTRAFSSPLDRRAGAAGSGNLVSIDPQSAITPSADQPSSTALPPPTSGVPEEAIRDYFTRAMPNVEAKEDVYRIVNQLRTTFAMGFLHALECRGQICRLVLTFSNGKEPLKLLRMNLIGSRQYIYKLEVIGRSQADLTIFMTAPGMTFRDLVKADSPHRRKGA